MIGLLRNAATAVGDGLAWGWENPGRVVLALAVWMAAAFLLGTVAGRTIAAGHREETSHG